MLCPKCGNILDDSETSCKNCGAKVKSSSLGKAAKEEVPKVEEPKVEVQPEEVPVQEEVYYDEGMYEQNYQYDMSQDEYDSLRQNVDYSKKNNNSVLIIVIVLVCVVTVFIGFLVVKQLRGDDIKATEATTVDPGKNLEPSTTDLQGQETVVKLNGYTFTVPGIYTVEASEEMVIARDYDNKVQLVFNVMLDVPYEEVLLKSKEYEVYLNELGFAVDSYKEVKFSNRNWLIFDGVLNDRNSMYAITALGSNDSFQVTIYNFGKKTNNAIYSELGKIIASSGADVKKEEPKKTDPAEGQNESGGNPVNTGTGDSVIA